MLVHNVKNIISPNAGKIVDNSTVMCELFLLEFNTKEKYMNFKLASWTHT
jgi:hypothetical protein